MCVVLSYYTVRASARTTGTNRVRGFTSGATRAASAGTIFISSRWAVSACNRACSRVGTYRTRYTVLCVHPIRPVAPCGLLSSSARGVEATIAPRDIDVTAQAATVHRDHTLVQIHEQAPVGIFLRVVTAIFRVLPPIVAILLHHCVEPIEQSLVFGAQVLFNPLRVRINQLPGRRLVRSRVGSSRQSGVTDQQEDREKIGHLAKVVHLRFVFQLRQLRLISSIKSN
jgi:hypothetical protein